MSDAGSEPPYPEGSERDSAVSSGEEDAEDWDDELGDIDDLSDPESDLEDSRAHWRQCCSCSATCWA